ncbi:MAG: cyclic nucleotide-binding domain-containing protein [Betaproteobacteria bacterium]
MSDLDFSKTTPGAVAPAEVTRPAASPVYNAAVAMEFFRGAGKGETVPAGGVLFAKDDKTSGLFSKNDKMYLLLEGEIAISVGDKVLGNVKVGEIFGEMATLTHLPRSATATARTSCRVMSIDGKQFEAGLQAKPEFALMLLAIMILRIRQTAASLKRGNAIEGKGETKPSSVFDKKLMAGLRALLRDREPVRYGAGQSIMKQGDTGAFMYIVASGVVAISIQGKVVDRVGAGGTFGEMALVDQSPRSANAAAEADCELLGLNRNDFVALVKSSPAFGTAMLTAMADRLTYMTSHFK